MNISQIPVKIDDDLSDKKVKLENIKSQLKNSKVKVQQEDGVNNKVKVQKKEEDNDDLPQIQDLKKSKNEYSSEIKRSSL